MTDNTVLMEGVRLVFRNFSGKPGKFNKEGTRNFGVVFPESENEKAEAMMDDGWPVKKFEPREDEDEEDTGDVYWMPVKVKYDGVRPPAISMITSRGRKILHEEDVEVLDQVDITSVDLIVRPYTWNVQGKTGIAAYLKTMFVTIEEDELQKKYADLDEQ